MISNSVYPTGSPVKKITLTGKLIPSYENRPVLLKIPDPEHAIQDNDFWYLPCFSNIEKLENIMKFLKVEYLKVVQISDETEFINSIRVVDFIKIIVDPYFTPEGKFRFCQVLEDKKNTN